jgi:hypothetical protein
MDASMKNVLQQDADGYARGRKENLAGEKAELGIS